MSTTSSVPSTAPAPVKVRAVRMDGPVGGRADAIRRCGEVLVDMGVVAPAYVDAMLAHERVASTYVGEGVAIPHGSWAGRRAVLGDALAVVRFSDGVDWDGHRVAVCVAIAARGDGHLELLSALARILQDPRRARALRETVDPDEIVQMLRACTEPPP